MIKFCCLLLLLQLLVLIVSEGRPKNDADRNAQILKNNFKRKGNDYKYSFETSNGIRREETGYAIDDDFLVLGSYAYTAPDGKLIKVKYLADEQGYREYDQLEEYDEYKEYEEIKEEEQVSEQEEEQEGKQKQELEEFEYYDELQKQIKDVVPMTKTVPRKYYINKKVDDISLHCHKTLLGCR